MNPEDFLPAALRAARLRESMPAGRRGLALIGRLAADLAVHAAPGCGTARLRQGREGPVIELDPAFCETHVQTDDDALALLGHEILHRVRGDLDRFVSLDQATWQLLNLALDVYVDAHLERLWFLGDGTAMTVWLYRWDVFPELLLVPPRALLRRLNNPASRAWLAHGPRPWLRRVEGARFELMQIVAPHLRQLGLSNPLGMAELYGAAWLQELPFAAFWDRFRPLLQAESRHFLRRSPPRLRGHHAPLGHRDDLGPWLRELLESTLGPARLPGLGQGLRARDLEPLPVDPDPGELVQALHQALAQDGDDAVPVSQLGWQPGVVGRPGRREALGLAAGAWPVFWQQLLPQPDPDAGSLHLYLDASGSMDEALPLATALVRGLGERLAEQVHLFSNAVVSMARGEVAEGRIETTGGTDFDCVVDHALARRWRRILVITDGYADLGRGLAGRAQAEGLEAYVVLFGPYVQQEHGLTAITRETWQYPEPTECRRDDDVPF